MDRMDSRKRASFVNKIIKAIKEEVYETLETDRGEDFNIPDEMVYDLIDEALAKKYAENILSISERERIRKRVFYDIRGLGLMEEFLEDKSISEIMVNGLEPVFVERGGRIENTGLCFESIENLEDISQKIASEVNRVVNIRKPILDARLKDGSRVNVILEPVAINGPIITVRKFPEHGLDMDNLVEKETLTGEAAEYLKEAVKKRESIFISGGTGSGKTTMLNVLSDFIPKNERVITIEDSAELNLKGLPNLVRLEARQENLEEKNAITIRDLLKASLRMRPDRIVVGEVRGDEVVDMLQAMNTGHDGSLSTGHANSCRDMLTRLEMMVLMGADLPISVIRNQIASAIDIIVHLERSKNGERKIVEISKVSGVGKEGVELEKVFELREESGKPKLFFINK